MELQSFKEILLKKSVGNNNLQSMIINIGEENLVQHVVEALEKMAYITGNMGKNANAAVKSWARYLMPSDVLQVRDAVSHHVSHYKAALKAHHEATDPVQKMRLRHVADRHLNKLIPLLHLVGKAERHSNGNIKLDYINPANWETNYTTLDRLDRTGKYKHDNEKLGRRLSVRAEKWSPENPEKRGVPDFHYLEMPPHPGHPEYEDHEFEGGYPWEETQIGSDKDVRAKKAYIHVEDVPNKSEFTPHPFDFHPINESTDKDLTFLHDIKAGDLSEERLHKFAEAMKGWKDSPHHQQWKKMQAEAYARLGKEGYAARGSQKAPHVYEGIPLQEQLAHIHNYPKLTKKNANRTALLQAVEDIKSKAADLPAAPQMPESVKATVAPMVRKPSASTSAPTPAPASAPKPAGGAHPLEATYNFWKTLKDDHPMKSVFTKSPEFQEYVKTREGK